MRRVRLGAALTLALVLLAGCSDSDKEEADPAPDPTPFTQLVTFEDAKTLPEIEAMAKELGGELVALWSSNLACVANVDANGPQPRYNPESPPPEPRRLSPFAYYKADELVARQAQGPPATDVGWSHSLRARFVEEWRAAQKPGAKFDAAVFHARGPIEDSVEVESYLTDQVGVRYLRGHEHALDAHITADAAGDPC